MTTSAFYGAIRLIPTDRSLEASISNQGLLSLLSIFSLALLYKYNQKMKEYTSKQIKDLAPSQRRVKAKLYINVFTE